MYTIMIVEDEEIIREGLACSIDWPRLGFQIIAQASNGQEALDLYHRHYPDVLLLDIKIPLINGIELLKIIKEENSDTQVILLSGFDDFSYAQSGIRYGAFAYILKIKLNEELESTLERLYQHFKNRENNQNQQIASLSRNSFLHSLKHFEISKPIPGLSACFCTMAIWSPNAASMIERLVSKARILPGCQICSHGSIVVITYGECVAQAFFQQFFQRQAHMLSSFLKSKVNGEVIIGIGNVHASAESLFLSYMEAVKAIDIARSQAHAPVVVFSALHLDALSRHAIEYKEFDRAVLLNQKDTLIALLQRTFHTALTSNLPHVHDLQILCEHLFIQFSLHQSGEAYKIYITGLIQRPYDFDSIIELQVFMLESIEKLSGMIAQGQLAESDPDIWRLKNYLDLHFREEIQLNDLTTHVHMGLSSISAKFKNATGKSIMLYIRDKRIDESCHLLSTTDMKIHEIAQHIGYFDEKYFSRIFKRCMGMSPIAYKKSASKA